MIMRRFLYIMIPLVLLSVLPAGAQKRDRAFKADAAYDAGEYYEAIDLYKDAYNKVSDHARKAEIIFRVAECYRITNQNRRAELWYRKAIFQEYPDPLIYLRYADMLKMDGDFEDALEQYKKYKELVPDDPRGQNGIISCELSVEWMENPTGYKVGNMRYINSRDKDYSPFYARDDYQLVYFTSSREESNGNDIHGATGENFADIFESRQDRKGKWSVPVPLNDNINTEFEDGTPVVNQDYNTLYFTRCKVNKNRNFGCQIYTARRNGEDWGKPDPVNIAPDSIIVAHPAISPDDKTLYFVSNMQGGYGGKDLWKVTRSSASGEWGEPENLGPGINTLGDELFPFVHADGTLYFSSDGRIGLGGLDIYKAVMDENERWKIGNMRYPINSTADDFGIVFEKDMERGFFSSSRKGRGNDDIYSFVLPPLKFSIQGSVRDEKTDEVLTGARVKCIGSDGVTLETNTEDRGSFKFMLKPSTDYVFVASRDGYLNGKERETTKGLDESRDFNTVIYLSSIDEPIELSNSNVFYDFAKWDLRPEAMVSLDDLVETLNDNPHVTIELMSHTDSRGTDEDNIVLSQKRAQSVVDYLISKGIDPERLQAKGYGESRPKEVTEEMHKQYPFLHEGVILTEDYISRLANEEQREIAHQFNRRTEFQVLTIDYNPEED